MEFFIVLIKSPKKAVDRYTHLTNNLYAKNKRKKQTENESFQYNASEAKAYSSITTQKLAVKHLAEFD